MESKNEYFLILKDGQKFCHLGWDPNKPENWCIKTGRTNYIDAQGASGYISNPYNHVVQVLATFYEIRSGHRNGEIHDWDAAWSKSKDLAEQCATQMWNDIEGWQYDDWVCGPHVRERQGDPTQVLVWDGFNEVPAKEYTG